MIDLNWYIESPIDFEQKNYVLLSYLKEVDESFSVLKLSPYLLWTERLIDELITFEKYEFEFKKSLYTPIAEITTTGIKRKEVLVNGEFREIIEIVNYSTPLLKSKVKLGYKLLDKYPQILY